MPSPVTVTAGGVTRCVADSDATTLPANFSVAASTFSASVLLSKQMTNRAFDLPFDFPHAGQILIELLAVAMAELGFEAVGIVEHKVEDRHREMVRLRDLPARHKVLAAELGERARLRRKGSSAAFMLRIRCFLQSTQPRAAVRHSSSTALTSARLGDTARK